MADKRCKIVLFSLVVLVVLILLGVLIAHKSNGNKSSKLCENPEELYFGDDSGNNGTCYPVKSSIPCENNLVLHPNPKNKSVGYCDCDSDSNLRATVYNSDDKKCYQVFTKAYCAHDEWLTISMPKPGVIKCKPNPCLSVTEAAPNGTEIVPTSDGRCVILGKTDSQNKNCSGSNVVQFCKKKIFPKCDCRNINIGYIGVPPPSCPTGSFNSPFGGCQPDFDFD